MFVSDLRKEFYEVVVGERVLVLVSFDVDALCACKILQYLFQCDHVVYTIVPVTGRQDLEMTYAENIEQIKHIVMINCGANIDVVELFQPADDIVFYIADNHRPIDVCNVYNANQVRLLMKPNEEEEIPSFEDIFRDDDDDDSESELNNESDEEGSQPQSKRKRFDEAALERRRERRLWEEKRQKILFDYTQFSFYGSSTAVLMFELSWKMSRDNNDVLWWAIIGLTEQFLNGKIESNKYVTDCGKLHGHVSRHNLRDDDDDSLSVDCIKIAFDKELQLALYRHWSLHDSLRHSMYVACKFKLWSMKGEKRLYEFLAKLGLPLAQVKQKFISMDMHLRSNIKTWIESKAEQYELDDIVYGSFNIQYGLRHKYCASDMVLTSDALLESVVEGKQPADCFLDALDSLSRQKLEVLEDGLEYAKKQLIAVFKQVQTFLETSQVLCAGPFLYAVLQESSPDVKFFSHPNCLMRLARFLLNAHSVVSRSKRTKNLPLLMATPLNEQQGTSLVLGIPPLSEESSRNFFGKAFEQAAEKTNSRILMDSFDSFVIQIRTEDRSRFFDALVALLH